MKQLTKGRANVQTTFVVLGVFAAQLLISTLLGVKVERLAPWSVSVTIACLSIWWREAPPRWRRAVYVAIIAAVTPLPLACPWIIWGPGAWSICNAHAEDPVENAVHFWLDAGMSVLLAPIAIMAVAAWHPPLRYARGSVLCVTGIWAGKVGWSFVGLVIWCGDPFHTRSSLLQFLFGASFSLLVACQFLIAILVALRVAALEAKMEKTRLAVKLYLVAALWCTCLGVGGLTPDHYLFLDVTLAVMPLLFAVLAVCAFIGPLRLLRAEALRVRCAVRAQVEWAARMLRREGSAVLLVLSMSELKAVYQVFHRSFGTTGPVVLSLLSSLDDLSNALGVAVMSGVLWQGELPAMPPRPAIRRPSAEERMVKSQSGNLAWDQKVREIAGRGFRVSALLDFFERLLEGEVMPSFSPQRSTTHDIVRQAIIPLSRNAAADGGGRALATVWNDGVALFPQRMVTHCWSNRFLDLVAAIMADAVDQSSTYEKVAEQLVEEGGIARLKRRLHAQRQLDMTYWVCALSINQHASICGGFGPAPAEGSPEFSEWEARRRDTVTGALLPTCPCLEPKRFNNEPTLCELNKFDNMMEYLFAEMPDFAQVVAMDMDFELFSRAWCVAELVEAESCGMSQRVVVHSEAALNEHYNALSMLDIRNCRASRMEDQELILSRIGDLCQFNARLQWLIFGSKGLFGEWDTGEDRAAALGLIASRVLAWSK